jgi:mRNA interferase HigB
VRIISKAKLREFWSKHPKTEAPLNAWHRVVEQADWSNPSDVRNSYRSADPVGDEFVVFDICDNDYRLVVRVDYERSRVYIYGVYTHPAYDRLNLRAIDEKIKREMKKREADRSS